MTRKWLVALVLAASVALISCSPSGDTKLDGRMLQAGKPFSYQIQPLLDLLVRNGASGTAGWHLTQAMAISPDGRWVVGFGRPPAGGCQAFRASLY